MSGCKTHKVRSQPRALESSGLALAPIDIGDKLIMLHQQRRNPWIVVRLLPNLQRVVVGRFRNWSDADGHLRILRQLIPTASLTIVFDPGDQI
ncbi:MAG TPA: hypothetical protein V6D26_17085 [Stenomitos sp.]